MFLPRLLAVSVVASMGLMAAAVLAGPADAATHRRHPAAHVRTATYKVSTPGKGAHHAHASRNTHRNVAQTHRHSTTRRG